jgi:WD40 repeat protein
MPTKKLEIREHTAGVYHIQFYNGFIYSSSADRFLTRWNPELGTQDKFAIRFEQSVFKFVIFKDQLLAGTASGDLHFFDLTNRREIKHYTNHTSAIFSMAIDEVRDQVFVGDADGNLTIWKWSTATFRAEFPMDCGKIRALTIHEDRLYLGGADGFIYVLDAEKMNLLERFYAHNEGVTALCVLGNTLYSGGKDAYLRSWNRFTCEKEKAVPAHNFAIYGLIAMNDQLISVSRDKSIKGFTSELKPQYRLLARDGGHSHSVNSICSINEQHFATCGDDRRIVLWSTEND